MLNVHKKRKNIYLFLLLLNLSFINNYETFNIIVSTKNDDSRPLYFNDSTIIEEDIKKCKQWIPSLFNPVLLVPQNKEIRNSFYKKFHISSPVLSKNCEIEIQLYIFEFLKFNFTLAKERYGDTVKECYFGLSSRIGNYSDLVENEINLNRLKNNYKKIFSFNKWNLSNDPIDFNLYLGESIDIFNPNNTNNNGTIASCMANKEDPFWGCSFKKMRFNNIDIDLNYEEDKTKYYKIYISSENHNIVFPNSFKKKFESLTNKVCEENDAKEIYCKNLFNSNEYIEIKLIDDKMIMTIEIDNVNRFNKGKEDQSKTRITYEEFDFFIFPLIMFKNFNIQFDAENNLISFYTTDKSILELKKEEENNSNNNEEKEDSNTGTVLLIIFIILLILVLGFVIFWLLKKRKNAAEKNINKYNKFDDENDFKDMSEKRVF